MNRRFYSMVNWMTGPGARFLLISTVLMSGISARAQTSVSQAPSMSTLLDQSYRAMYNLDFEEAFRQAERAKAVSPENPLPWMAQACAVLFREFDRLHILRSEMFTSDDTFSARPAYQWATPAKAEFETALNGAQNLARREIARDNNDPTALFALALINGLRADDAALIGKKDMAALSFTRAANSYAERLLAKSPDYYDAYVATGMGKYIIGGKAAPVRWLLRLGGLKGDRQEGVKDLTLAAEHGRYLAPFARILLAFDDIRRNDRVAARQKFAALHDQFPNNPLFLQELARLDHATVGRGQ